MYANKKTKPKGENFKESKDQITFNTISNEESNLPTNSRNSILYPKYHTLDRDVKYSSVPRTTKRNLIEKVSQ